MTDIALYLLITRISTISFRGIPTVEENLRQGMKEVSAVMESAVDIMPIQDPAPEVCCVDLSTL